MKNQINHIIIVIVPIKKWSNTPLINLYLLYLILITYSQRKKLDVIDLSLKYFSSEHILRKSENENLRNDIIFSMTLHVPIQKMFLLGFEGYLCFQWGGRGLVGLRPIFDNFPM